MRSRRTLCGIACAAWLVGSTVAAGAEQLRVESVGVAPIGDEQVAPRDAALRAAVAAAAVGVARGLLPDDFAPPGGGGGTGDAEADAWIAERLGDDPFVYATRFRILEDRGQRPAMFASDPAVRFEYVVDAEVTLDAGAIRDRLASLGLLGSSSPSGTGRRLRFEIEGLTSYPALAMLRELLLDARGVRSALPVEFGPRSAVLAVDADRDAPDLVGALQRRAPEGLRIVPVEQAAAGATLLLEWDPPAPPPAEPD